MIEKIYQSIISCRLRFERLRMKMKYFRICNTNKYSFFFFIYIFQCRKYVLEFGEKSNNKHIEISCKFFNSHTHTFFPLSCSLHSECRTKRWNEKKKREKRIRWREIWHLHIYWYTTAKYAVSVRVMYACCYTKLKLVYFTCQLLWKPNVENDFREFGFSLFNFRYNIMKSSILNEFECVKAKIWRTNQNAQTNPAHTHTHALTYKRRIHFIHWHRAIKFDAISNGVCYQFCMHFTTWRLKVFLLKLEF